MKIHSWLFPVLTLVAVSILYLFVYSSVPVYGDAWGYGYKCASWLSHNGLPLIPSGTGRGETAGGHAAFYFWLWALFMKVFGSSIFTAHLLPAVFTYFAVTGTYSLGRDLGGKLTGTLSGAALLASPLFLAQAFRPLPIAAVMAMSVWGLFFYNRGQYFKASAMMIFAVMMREQAMMVPLACLAADLFVKNKRHRKRILLLLLPFLVPVINGISNYLVNGYVFMSGNTPGIDQPFSFSLALHRLKFFGYFLTADYRWIPLSAGVGLLYGKEKGILTGTILGILLCFFGTVARFQNYFTVLLFLALMYQTVITRKSSKGIYIALILIPYLMILFFTLIVFVTATQMEYTFFRYLMAGFPALITGAILLLSRWGWKGHATAGIFILLTMVGNFQFRNEANYSDTTLAGYRAPLLVVRDAGTWATRKDLPVLALCGTILHFENPELGYVETPLSVIPLREFKTNPVPGEYAVVVPPVLPWGENAGAVLDSIVSTHSADTEIRLHTDTLFTRGPFSAECFTLTVLRL
ncbi:MAG: glycosyltransferase family 39 protein [Candidatus Fermentibacteraceae bacterium]|nr:glycosyltransferase family 39 protein [Candidatus Fermentibacteraceae bacterium]